MLASKALKLNFNALNPANGFKALFSLGTVKDVLKTLLFLTSFIIAGMIF
ncbi:MAG: EscU/YscU/HrcU family type III secretion system export apparatus switch protein [Candidatus Malihini olakiniferum]